MHRINRIIAALVVAVPAAPLGAGETTLEFKLFTRTVEQTAYPAPVEGLTVVAVRAAGVGIFADGSISNKEFAFNMHNKGATGETSTGELFQLCMTILDSVPMGSRSWLSRQRPNCSRVRVTIWSALQRSACPAWTPK